MGSSGLSHYPAANGLVLGIDGTSLDPPGLYQAWVYSNNLFTALPYQLINNLNIILGVNHLYLSHALMSEDVST